MSRGPAKQASCNCKTRLPGSKVLACNPVLEAEYRRAPERCASASKLVCRRPPRIKSYGEDKHEGVEAKLAIEHRIVAEQTALPIRRGRSLEPSRREAGNLPSRSFSPHSFSPGRLGVCDRTSASRSPSSCSRRPTSRVSSPSNDETQQRFSVSVFVHIRPASARERGESRCVRTDGTTICIRDPVGVREHHFTFESVIDSSSGSCDQKRVFDTLGARAMRSLADGYHTCLFALGQTGTGKTYTLIGNAETPGLLPWALRHLLEPKEGQAMVARCCRLSCMEIHMDRLHDLLVSNPSARNGLDIRCHPQTGVSVSNLSEVVVKDAPSAIRLVNLACRRRNVTHTSMNAVSSRGHAIFQVVNDAGARLCIVDLAGRENERTTQCRGQSLAELGYINKSLFHLTSVIQALARPSPGTIVPFRNSKLTLFLSESLQCARTFLLATASPALGSFDETLTTLRLAHAVRHIKTRSKCTNFRDGHRYLYSSGDSRSPMSRRIAKSPERTSFTGLQSAGRVPFAPRLTPTLSMAADQYSPDTSRESCEIRPLRCRLEAWKLASLCASSCSTAAADSRATTEFGDSDRQDSDRLLSSETTEESPDNPVFSTEVLLAPKLR